MKQYVTKKYGPANKDSVAAMTKDIISYVTRFPERFIMLHATQEFLGTMNPYEVETRFPYTEVSFVVSGDDNEWAVPAMMTDKPYLSLMMEMDDMV